MHLNKWRVSIRGENGMSVPDWVIAIAELPVSSAPLPAIDGAEAAPNNRPSGYDVRSHHLPARESVSRSHDHTLPFSNCLNKTGSSGLATSVRPLCEPRPQAKPKQHFLYFCPLPHGQGSLRPIFRLIRDAPGPA